MSYNDTVLAEAGPSSQTITPVEARFVRQFRQSGGTLSRKCRFAHYETMGCGFKAAETIEEGEALFSIPRHMLLSLKTSILPDLCTLYERDAMLSDSSNLLWSDVNTGWLGLMLTMMWEQFRSSPQGKGRFREMLESYKSEQKSNITSADEEMESGGADESGDPEGGNEYIGQYLRHGGRPKGKQDWGFYFDILPRKFETPMFWSEEDLAELKGTSIPGKIGKDEATKDYLEKIRPYVSSRPSVFFGSLEHGDTIEGLIDEHYSVETFHMMGSRILSRSFHVKDAQAGVLGEEGKEYDEQETKSNVGSDSDSDSEGSEEEEGDAEDINTISMVPMADMLNARNGCDNAHLFYMPDRLEMRATQRIPAGSQIFNTYGDPPSSDLLRRYGYVDLGNAADVVELGVSDLVQSCLVLESGDEARRAELLQRVAWSCSLGLDEIFPLTYPFPPSEKAPHHPIPEKPTMKELKEAAMGIPEELLIQARLLCLGEEALEKAKKKEKLPNPRIDAVEENRSGSKRTSLGVAELLHQAIEVKLNNYPTTLEEDEKLLYGSTTMNATPLSTNLRSAIVVRLSEKRILRETQKVLTAALSFVTHKKRDTAQINGHSSKRVKV